MKASFLGQLPKGGVCADGGGLVRLVRFARRRSEAA
jgi:hypothetical protein